MTNPKQKHVPGSLGAINASIESISKKGRAFDTLIQNTGLEVLDWSHKNNDLDLVNRFVLAVPSGSKKTSLIVWLCTFGRLQPNKGSKEELQLKPLVWRKDGVLNVEGARSKLWHSCVKEPDPILSWDIESKFAAFMKQVIANKDKVTNPVLLAALENVQGVVKSAPAAVESLDLIGPHAVKS